MNLLNITTKYLLFLISGVIMLFTIVFYFSIKKVVYDDLDEYIKGRRHEILQNIEADHGILHDSPSYHKDFSIAEIPKNEFNEFQKKYGGGRFEDYEKFEALEGENEPYRKMESVFFRNNKYYKITVSVSIINSEELLYIIFFNIIILNLLLVACIVFFNRLLLQKLWKPFYNNLQKMKEYRLDKEGNIELEPSKISEFRDMKNSVEKLIDNNLKVYHNQKQFTENASHEIQTPLAIAQGKVDLLIETSAISSEQAGLIQGISENLERLSRLNKTLLLLSKIDNNQFLDMQEIDLCQLIRKNLGSFTELIEHKNITTSLSEVVPVKLLINSDLANILFSNLIKNAVYHNQEGGYISIKIQENNFTIENSGKETIDKPELMFERFNKKSTNINSYGLGLAIVKSICNLYKFRIGYSVENKIHNIFINF